MEPRNILIVGNYGAGNLGDDAILGGILTDLKNVGYAGIIAVTHGGVKTSSEIYKGLKKVPFVPSGFRSRFKKNRKEAYDAVQAADLMILGGGGLFTDAESRRAPFIWAAQAKAALKLKKPYICYGQSVGPLKSFWSRHLAKKVFKKATAVHVRDQSSADLLASWKIEATVGTDPALSWLLAERRNIPKKPVILISLRTWPGFSSAHWEPLIKEIKVFAKKKKLKPMLLSMDTNNAKEILALKATNLEVFEPNSALQAFEGIQKASLAVTMRLHAGIFALAGRTPFIALSYSQKVIALLSTLKVKGGFELLSEKKLTAEELRRALKEIKLTQPQSNLESPLMHNQAFLAQQLERS